MKRLKSEQVLPNASWILTDKRDFPAYFSSSSKKFAILFLYHLNQTPMHHLLEQLVPSIEREFLAELQSKGQIASIPAGTTILREGAFVSSVPIVLQGLIKVFRTSEERDLLLYYIRPGESCIMSFNGCLNQSPSQVVAKTEEDTEVLLIPAESLSDWLNRFPSLSRFLFALYNKRYENLLFTVDQLIFGNLEDRLVNYLKQMVINQETQQLRITHQEIATDLGTSRVVVSRMLKKWEEEGKIVLSRNQIEVM